MPGHVGPATRLARVLAEQGHRVVAWTLEAFRAETEAAGAFLRPTSSPEPPRGVEWRIADLAAHTANAAAALIPEIVEGLHEEDVELVVHDVQAPWGRIAAEWLGLKRVCSWPFFPPIRTFESPPVGEISRAARAEVIASRAVIGHRWGIDVGNGADGFGATADVTLVYTTPEIAGDRGAGDHRFRYVGPLMRRDLNGAEPAPAETPLVYMALGTIYGGERDVFRMVLDALADEPVRVLASTGGHLDADALAPLPANARVEIRVDSPAVLREAAVHVSHGGASSIHESLVAGVPMVLIPQGSDNPAWATRLAELGAGRCLDHPSGDAVRGAVRHLLRDDRSQARARALGDRLVAFDGEAVVAAAVDEELLT